MQVIERETENEEEKDSFELVQAKKKLDIAFVY